MIYYIIDAADPALYSILLAQNRENSKEILDSFSSQVAYLSNKISFCSGKKYNKVKEGKI